MTLQFKFPKLGGRKGLRLWNNKAGNIAIITALMMIPLTFALGMAYDYTMAESRQDQINGMADVATLAGVTPNQMTNPYGTAKTFSSNLFASQIATVNGVVGMSTDWVSCGGQDNSSGATVTRTMCVTYTAASQNVFAKLLGMDTFPLAGASTATSTTAPNIDFYLLMDTSPSMEIAATSAGIATLIANTQQESDITPKNKTDYWKSNANWPAAPNGNGCAFGCHESSPNEGTFLNQAGKPIQCTANGVYADNTAFSTATTFPITGRDNYDLSRCLGITLRIDLLNTAAQSLMDTARLTGINDHATYQMAIYETSSNLESDPLTLHRLQSLTPDLTSSGAKGAAASLVSLTMCNNNNYACGDKNGDEDTDLDDDLAAMNTSGNPNYIPNPGTGAAGNKPQEVLFIVTDAQNDYNRPNYLPMDQGGATCSAIKARGIRIAVLYTTSIPLEESWYQQAVEPSLGSVGGFSSNAPPPTDVLAKAAQTCASAGLYYEVSTDGDVTAALNHLFQEAVAQARLLK
jgi:Flp pilus assembly protein TadG